MFSRSLLLSVALLAAQAAAGNPPGQNETAKDRGGSCKSSTIPFGWARGENISRGQNGGCSAPGEPIVGSWSDFEGRTQVLDDIFYPYDVWYNGTTSLQWDAPSSSCAPFKGERQAVFRIGQQMLPSNSTIRRDIRDANLFWFALSLTEADKARPDCASDKRSCPPSIQLVSSNPYSWWAQNWNITATKAGDGYDLTGKIWTEHINPNGLMLHLPVWECDVDKKRTGYEGDSLNAFDQVSMTGHISPSKVDLTINVASMAITTTRVLPPFSFKYTGTFWKDSANLVVTGDTPATQGIAKGFKDPITGPQEQQKAQDAKKSRGKWLYPVIGIGAILGLIIIGVALCCCCGCASALFNRKKGGNAKALEGQSNVEPVYIQHEAPKQYENNARFEPYTQQGYNPQAQPQRY